MDGEIFTGFQGGCHIQGIAVDEKERCIYCSFTTKLIKYDFSGNVLGSVTGLTGHMGCITFCPDDKRIYGSLEYKNDNIGKSIHRILGTEKQNEDAFYLVGFDTEKITEENMDAFDSGIMKAMYLKEATDDYKGFGIDCDGQQTAHKFGCSGIDGTGYAPIPGEEKEDKYIMVAYGIYRDKNRDDNDNQVILCYEREDFERYATPLNEDNMHQSGPQKPLHKFFVYTGNTDWGVQNLEYDAFTGDIFLAVYPGNKPQYRNFPMFRINGNTKAVPMPVKGTNETGEHLTLTNEGIFFAYGSTGMYSFGDGRFLFSQNGCENAQEYSRLKYYRFNTATGNFDVEK